MIYILDRRTPAPPFPSLVLLTSDCGWLRKMSQYDIHFGSPHARPRAPFPNFVLLTSECGWLRAALLKRNLSQYDILDRRTLARAPFPSFVLLTSECDWLRASTIYTVARRTPARAPCPQVLFY